MKRLLLFLLLAVPAIAQQNWYIRDDGGDYNQCSGHADAPFAGAKNRKKFPRHVSRKTAKVADCALFSPFMLVKPGGVRAWRDDFHGGDTVWFRRNASGGVGQYPLGLYNSHTDRGIWMPGYGFAFCDGDQYGCYLPPIPSGTREHPTRFLGPCYPNCSNASGTDVVGAARLLGINGVYLLLNFEGSEWFDVEGFELTQPDQCTIAQGTSGGCGYKDFAGHGLQIQIQRNQGPSNGILRHISVHGIAGQGLLGSHLNKTADDKMVLDHLYIRGNGMSGFDSDGGDCRTYCENLGRVEFTNSLVDFNGCVTPPDVQWDAGGLPSSVNFCSAQTMGGYGDGISFIAMGDVHVFIDHVKARYNTQDGFDLLHMGDDQTHRQTLEVYNSVAIGNMGQSFKIGGGADTYFVNNFANANCKVMPEGKYALFAHFPAGWNASIQVAGDYCRAGDNLAVYFSDGRKTTLIHNTVTGYQPVMYDMLCAAACTGTDLGDFRDNISFGYHHPDNGQLPSGLYFNGINNPFANPGSVISHNIYWEVRNGGCPAPVVAQETASLCVDPKLADESNVDSFDPNMIHTDSPAYNSGVAAGLPVDYHGKTWLSSPSRGLTELGGAVPPQPQPQTKTTFRGVSR